MNMQLRPTCTHMNLNHVLIWHQKRKMASASTDAPTMRSMKSSLYHENKQFSAPAETAPLCTQHMQWHVCHKVREAVMSQLSARCIISFKLDALLHEASHDILEPEVDDGAGSSHA